MTRIAKTITERINSTPSSSPAAIPDAAEVQATESKKLEPDTWGGAANRIAASLRVHHPEKAAQLAQQLSRIESLAQQAQPSLPSDSTAGEGRPISSGVASGVLVRSLADAEAARERGEAYVFAVDELSVENIELAAAAQALIVPTLRSELTDRAIKALARPAIALERAALDALESGTVISIDGSSGSVVPSEVKPRPADPNALAKLSEELKTLSTRYPVTVTAHASSPASIERAVSLGADSVRVDTSALLQEPRTLFHLRSYLLAGGDAAAPKRAALEQITTAVRSSAMAIFESLGETGANFVLGAQAPQAFFPVRPEDLDAIADERNMPAAVVRERVSDLGAGNSKLGLKGARWGVKDPALFGAIARGLLEAAAARQEQQAKIGPMRFTLPSVALGGELGLVKKAIEAQRAAVAADFGLEVPVQYGAGIDAARGAMSADRISEHADFIEYGLADLTETVFGISRDDAEPYMSKLIDEGIYPSDPFVQPDVRGVGEFVRVGQFLAGPTANQFPAALTGPQALQPNALHLAEQAGIRELVVPVESCVEARVQYARMKAALDQAAGLSIPNSWPRDEAAKVFDLLTDLPVDGSALPRPGAIPNGKTALEHVEELKADVDAGRLASSEALMKMPAEIVDLLGKPVIDPKANARPVASGLKAHPGCGQGRIALSKEKAAEYEAAGTPYVFIVTELHADETEAAKKAKAIISVRGGTTSHAAFIAAGNDVPCVMNDKVRINLDSGTVGIGKYKFKEDGLITVDGTKGQIYADLVPLLNPSKTQAFESILKWADEHRTLGVMANASTKDEAIAAFAKGAAGIGLARTEQMMTGDRMQVFRSCVLRTPEEAKEDLAKLGAMQQEDFEALFTAAEGKKVVVRLLDPPIYEYLPTEPKDIEALAQFMGLSPEEVAARITEKQEVDSMLGARGARLALIRPDIEAMQLRALAMAYVAVVRAGGHPAPLHITVPQLTTGTEFKATSERMKKTLAEVKEQTGIEVPLKLGAMIETARGALDAGEMAKVADYFSYGTNDLTQSTLGYGRNVGAKFIGELTSEKVLKGDPTAQLDPDGVAKLMRLAEYLGRGEAAHLESGICGGQASDPESIRTAQRLGVNYLSVPAGQVHKARFAAAQAAIASKMADQASAANQTNDKAKHLLKRLARAREAIVTIPVPASQRHVLEHAELLVRQTGALLRTLEQSMGATEAIIEHRPLFQAYVATRELLDMNRLASAIDAELGSLELMGRAANASPAIAPALADARKGLEGLSTQLADRLKETKTSTSHERTVAAAAWDALRALEAAREQLIEAGALGTEHADHVRLRHKNDGWDNNHYTRGLPSADEPMGAYLKRVAKDFLNDNGITVATVGEQNIPKDKKIIFAVTHRSGAIDRFVVSASLPVGDDKFMYMVREQSPVDRIATKVYGAKNPWIIPANHESIDRAKEGFAAGDTALITYPEGTGTITGESRYAAIGTARMALETGATIVPVALDDSFEVRPYREDTVTVRYGEPIDPAEIQKSLAAKSRESELLETVHSAMRYQLAKNFRSVL